ncbi:MAG: hypothetical protein AAGB46_17230 [Verrucomicrobiota bacterium]
MSKLISFIGIVVVAVGLIGCSGEKQWQVYKGKAGEGLGKKIVLISGDEEYRSEELMPQLGKMLANSHGFECRVLFAQNPEVPGQINPNYLENIPGLEALEEADLMIIATRFRNLPDEQMKMIEDYLLSGRPVVGYRTATHAFKIPEDRAFAHWSFNYKGEKTDWEGGFGRLVLGTTWIAHHGWHKKESTRGIVVKGSPLGNGIGEGEIWSTTDVYGTPYPLPGDSQAIALGQVLDGMEPDDEPIGAGPYEKAPRYGQNNPKFHKNAPMMPIAWTKSYQIPGGEKGRVFVSTLGASLDLKESGVRTLFGNGIFWALGLEIPAGGAQMEIVGDFNPTMFSFNKEEGHYEQQNLRVSDLDW